MAFLDSQGMFALTAGLPEQLEESFRRAGEVTGLPQREDVTNVVVIGMGGSGIAGDVLQAVASPLLPVPVTVVKHYECPHFVDEGSLVFAVSGSGKTEETIEAATDAALAGARMVVVTSGGELERLADGWQAPVVGLPDVPWPRLAFGAMVVPLLVSLWRMGFVPGVDVQIERAVEQLKWRRDELARREESSEAAEVARRIGVTVPLIYGGGTIGAAAALRWKSQVNENAKRLAFVSSQPELCHNEICAWAEPSRPVSELMSLVCLRHDAEHPQVGRRFDLSGERARPFVSDIIEVRAQGEGDFAQLMDLAFFGDFVSLWLAAYSGVDPGPIDALMSMKRQLSGLAEGAIGS